MDFQVTSFQDQNTLSCWMLKKGDVNNDANDDEMRTSVSQNRERATPSNEEFFLGTQYLKLSPHISREAGGRSQRRYTVNAIPLDGPS
jgi:hypothetical protein